MSETELERMRKIVGLTLIKLGFRRDLTGFDYIVCGVELVVQNQICEHPTCSQLYGAIQKHFPEVTIAGVERAIRHVIEWVFDDNEFRHFDEMFGAKISGRRPTTLQLIKLVAEYYNMSLYKNDSDFDCL